MVLYTLCAVQMPPMPSVYSSELVNLIRAMLNKTAAKRPSVSRVLRDPYIKRNIALFLEETCSRFLLQCTVFHIIDCILMCTTRCFSKKGINALSITIIANPSPSFQ